MAKKVHQNLFNHVVDGKKEVYEALQRDYDKDTWRQLGWHAVFWICAVVGTRLTGHSDWLWIFGSIYAVERSLARYIDNSNRNWAMHVIDWMEHSNSEQAKAAQTRDYHEADERH
jgi:hypothetical protein